MKMDMTREAMEFLKILTEQAADIKGPVEICGRTYVKEKLIRMDELPMAKAFEISTLTGLVDYVTKCQDEYSWKNMIIHVESPSCVRFFSFLDGDRRRETLCIAEAKINNFRFDQWMGQEEFILKLQANFMPTADRELLLRLAGNVMSQNNATYADDGITQTATMKTGISSASNVQVPNPVTLAPFRTFQEIAQPETQYVFRMKFSEDRPLFLLSDASNGIWANNAIISIKNYIREALKDKELKKEIIVIG